jgi:glycogenin glucosyltransferase
MKTYATIITTDDYLLGALALHKSLMMTSPRHDLLVLLTISISVGSRRILDRQGVRTLTLDREFNMPEKAKATNTRSGMSHWNHTLSKLLIFDLTQYEKIVFLDADMMVLQNLDHLFKLPHMSALVADKLCHEHWVQLNAGLMVIEPQSGLAASIVSHASALERTGECFGMEPLLHAQYPDWPERPELHLNQKYNVFFSSIERYVNRYGYNVNWTCPDDKTIAVLHFIGLEKPWSLSRIRQLKRVLREISRFNLVSTKALCRYFLIINSVRNGEHAFRDKVFSCVLNLLGNLHDNLTRLRGELPIIDRLTQLTRANWS